MMSSIEYLELVVSNAQTGELPNEEVEESLRKKVRQDKVEE